MAKVQNIIEYQEDRQRNPQEAIDYIQREIDENQIKTLLIIGVNADESGFYIAASVVGQFEILI